MKKIILIMILMGVSIQLSFAKNIGSKYYGQGLCSNPQYHCVTIKKGGGWKALFPNPYHRDLVQRINRTNMYLWRGRKIAVPYNIESLSIYDISPFPKYIKKYREKTIIVDQHKLAWGAYNNGELIKWGPISSGKNYCRDVKRNCTTPAGIYYIFNKKDKRCASNIFPVGRGGAKMPYCMFYYRGYALHGSHEVPGYRDSHGCVRLFTEDAKWLNETFIDIATEENNYKGTKIIIQKLSGIKKMKRNGKK